MAGAVLEDYQFELGNVTFGRRLPVFVDTAGFDPGSADTVDQDIINPVTGARMMGRDVITGPTWTWMFHVDGEDEESALTLLGQMGAAWRNGSAGFADARTYIPLRYRIAGRTRVVYGRPRRFDYKPDSRILSGYLAPSATFVCADSLHYSDTEAFIDVSMSPPVNGGASWPAVFPLTFQTTTGYVPPGELVVGGDAPTAPVVTFYGPVTNPSMTIGSFVLGLTGSIGEGGSVTIDARPWVQSVRRSGNTAGASVSRDTRITRARLKPGSYDAVFRGISASSQARCRVVWRDAWHTL